MVRVLTELAGQDSNVVLITGDLGFGVLTDFASRFPTQFLNAGVAEQNMTGLAVGMALEGKTAFTYSIGNFPTLRCLEQIRNDACYHNVNVKIVAVGGGFTYGALGISHHATEDLAIMRALPDITVIAPGDPIEAAEATRAVYHKQGTCYLRLGRGGEPRIHQDKINFKIGKAIKLMDGEDIAIFSTGGILQNAVSVSYKLREKKYNVGLHSMHTLKPLDRELILSVSEKARLIVTIEEHSVIGGLGSAVAEILAQYPKSKSKLKIIGLEDCFSCVVGDQDYLRETYNLSTDKIVNTIIGTINYYLS